MGYSALSHGDCWSHPTIQSCLAAWVPWRAGQWPAWALVSDATPSSCWPSSVHLVRVAGISLQTWGFMWSWLETARPTCLLFAWDFLSLKALHPEKSLRPRQTGIIGHTTRHNVFKDLSLDRIPMTWDPRAILVGMWEQIGLHSPLSNHHLHSWLFVNATEPGLEEALPHRRLAELVKTCYFSFYDLVLNRIME